MKHSIKNNLYGFIAITLALAMVVGASVSLIQMNASATAEAVTVTQAATVVASPFTEAVQKVKGSVVGVNNYVNYSSRNQYGDFFGYGRGGSSGDIFGNGRSDDQDIAGSGRQVLSGSGSGVVIAKGYVLTNYHVIEGANTLEITMGDKTYKASVAGSDEGLDIAVLYSAELDIEPVVLGDSDVLQVGDWAICIGNPLSFTATTTVGIISALDREISTTTTYDRYGLRRENVNKMIQTDAAINAGNSGGGMFNVAGELVGVPSMKYTGSFYSSSSVEGIGMAIPINEAKVLIEKVISEGAPAAAEQTPSGSDENTASIQGGEKPRIGVTVSDLNRDNYAVSSGLLPAGAYVTNVEAGSPAETAGMLIGDIVVEVGGKVVTNMTEMVDALQSKKAGDMVTIKLFRVEGLEDIEDYSQIKGEYIDLTVELKILDNVKQ